MKTVSLEVANKHIRNANNRGHDVEVHFDGEVRTFDVGNARIFSPTSEPGTYVLKVRTPAKDNEEPVLTEYLVQIDPPAPPPEPPAPVVTQAERSHIPEGSLNDPMKLMLAMREQDQLSWDNERRFHQSQIENLKAQHRAEIDRIRAEHQAEIHRIKADHELQRALIETNMQKLERDREEIYKTIDRRVRAEYRYSKGAAETAWIDKLSENPVLLMMAAKFAGLDMGAMGPLLAGMGSLPVSGGSPNLEEAASDLMRKLNGGNP